MIKLLLVDDHPTIVEGLRIILSTEPEIEVVATARDASTAVALAIEHQPNVVLMDIQLESGDGVGASEEILKNLPQTRVLIFSSYGDDQTVLRSINAGVSGFVLKTSKPSVLVSAIQQVADGEGYIDPQLVSTVLDICRSAESKFGISPNESDTPRTGGLEFLTTQETRVLRLVGKGHSNAEIGDLLSISNATVKSHINRMFAKLGVRDRPQAILRAIQAFDDLC